jgi:anti-anti-sigma factor
MAVQPAAAHLVIDERQEAAGLRLTLTGELDVASVPLLRHRLSELRGESSDVRLDLSALEFIDSSGLALLVRSIRDARRDGWGLQIEPHVTPQVMRLLKLTQVDTLLVSAGTSTPQHKLTC